MDGTKGNWAREQLAELDCGWERMSLLLNRLEPDGFNHPLSDTWTVKEMLAHLAFWEETSLPVINTIFRGGAELLIEEWYGGTDLELAPDAPWPDADTHNAREARWARSRSAEEIIERLRKARQKLKTVIATVSDEESRGPIGEQWSADTICRHVDQHLAQVEASGALAPTTG